MSEFSSHLTIDGNGNGDGSGNTVLLRSPVGTTPYNLDIRIHRDNLEIWKNDNILGEDYTSWSTSEIRSQSDLITVKSWEPDIGGITELAMSNNFFDHSYDLVFDNYINGSYSTNAGLWGDSHYQRLLTDIDGDGHDDLVGIGQKAVYVSYVDHLESENKCRPDFKITAGLQLFVLHY